MKIQSQLIRRDLHSAFGMRDDARREIERERRGRRERGTRARRAASESRSDDVISSSIIENERRVEGCVVEVAIGYEFIYI
jgi:hypothetical protein